MCIGGIRQFGVVIWQVSIVLKLDLEDQTPVMGSNKIIIYVFMVVNRF